MKRVRRADTEAELALHKSLEALGVSFTPHQAVSGTRATPDLVVTGAMLAVFIDGCFWHGCPKHRTAPAHNAEWWRAKLAANRERDTRVNAELRRAGWRVIRVWEHEPPSAAAQRVAEAAG